MKWRIESALGAGWLAIDPAGFGVLFTEWHEARDYVVQDIAGWRP